MKVNSVTIRYCIAGLFVLAADYGTLNLLVYFGVPLVLATSISFIVGSIIGYTLHSTWTFKQPSKERHLINFSQFLLVGGIGLLITDVVVYICTSILLFNYNISKTIAVHISIFWAYSASRWWVFKSKSYTNKAKKRILILSPYYPPHIGGLESNAHEFNVHMTKAGWSITVWTTRIPTNAPQKENIQENITVYRYNAFEIINGFFIPAIWKYSFWIQWKEIYMDGSYSYVISRTRFFLSSIMAQIIAQVMSIPHVHIEHGSYYVSQKNRFINTIAYVYDITLGRCILKQADIVIANSQATAKFVSQLTKNKVRPHVVYRGVEHQEIISNNKKYVEKDSKIVLTYAGRLVGGKGIHDLLEAIPLCTTKDHIRCNIVGDGPLRVDLEELSRRMNLQHIVHFWGAQTRSKTIEIMEESDIIINPSYTEGLPTSIIEASLCGKAIIATNVGGTNEIVQDTISAILIHPRDASALAQSIDTLVTHPELRTKLGNAAKKGVEKKFLWDNAIQAYEAILLPSQN